MLSGIILVKWMIKISFFDLLPSALISSSQACAENFFPGSVELYVRSVQLDGWFT